MGHQKDAVASGYWPLYRYHPSPEAGTHPFSLDSKKPTVRLREFQENETRFAVLAKVAAVGAVRTAYDETSGILIARKGGHADFSGSLLQEAGRGQLRRPSEVTSPQLIAYVTYYEQQVPQNQHERVIDDQIRVFRHNREHYQKITASLLPILSMLTSGDLGKSLSPDPFDLDDTRPIMNFEKIERGGHVLYMCLDSLPDPSVASAIGALAIADVVSGRAEPEGRLPVTWPAAIGPAPEA